MKFLIFILVFSLQVQAAGKCAEYFIAIADLKKLELSTQNQKAFAKALIEEPSLEVLEKLSREFGVSIAEIRNDIKSAPTVEAKKESMVGVKGWELKKIYEIKPEVEIDTITALHGGFFSGAVRPFENSYLENLFDSTGKKLSALQMTNGLTLSNKARNENPLTHPRGEILSPSGLNTLKVNSDHRVEVRDLLSNSIKTLKSKGNIVTAVWGNFDIRIFALEYIGLQMKITWYTIGQGQLNKINEHALEKLSPMDALILSPDKKNVLILHKDEAYQIKEASIWDSSEGTLKTLELGVTPYESAHFTTSNNIVFLKNGSNVTPAKIFNIEGSLQGHEHFIETWHAEYKISPDGDYAVMIFNDHYGSASYYHFDTRKNAPLPNHLKIERVSFSPDEKKLYLLEARDKISVWENISLQLKPKKGSK